MPARRGPSERVRACVLSFWRTWLEASGPLISFCMLQPIALPPLATEAHCHAGDDAEHGSPQTAGFGQGGGRKTSLPSKCKILFSKRCLLSLISDFLRLVFLLLPLFSILIESAKSWSEAFPVNFRLAVSKNPTLKYPRRQKK